MQLSPMLLTSSMTAWDSDEWTAEIKWDGWRCLVTVSSGAVRLTSRHGVDLTSWFPHLQDVARELGVRRSVFDCELVAFNDAGMPDFERLKRRAPAHLVIFDVLSDREAFTPALATG